MSENQLGSKFMGARYLDQRSQQRSDPLKVLPACTSTTDYFTASPLQKRFSLAQIGALGSPEARSRFALLKDVSPHVCLTPVKSVSTYVARECDSRQTLPLNDRVICDRAKALAACRRTGSSPDFQTWTKGLPACTADSGSNDSIYGMVVAVQANYYRVKLDTLPKAVKSSEEMESGQFLLCTRRTRLKKIGQKVMVGDRVLIEEADWQAGRGAIGAVLPRTTELHRPPVANASQILLVFALAEPLLDPWQLSRFLVKAESTSLELSLCLNKSDLIDRKQQKQWQLRLADWGYKANFVSVSQPSGIDELRQKLEGKITVVAGPSGVGKSSLIDFLIPEANLRVGEVSGKLQRGRHTTRHVELFELPRGGLLADTPGFNQPDLNCLPSQLALYFPEARARLEGQSCQFNDCLHRDEPGCVVRGDWERYEYYQDFLTQAISQAAEVQQQPAQESKLKLTIKKAGKSQYEPKLQTKKYRRTSRKTRHQNLQDIYEQQLEEEIED